MKLHELVKLRNDLQQSYDSSILIKEIEKNCQRLESLTPDIDLDLAYGIKDIADQHKKIINQFDVDVKNINAVIQLIQDKINSLSTKFFQENYQLEMICSDPTAVRNIRNLNKDEEFESTLVQRILMHSTWQYPALEIGCRDGEWTKYLVASDPLYIADISLEFLESAIQQFEPLYRGRVRKYLIQDFYKIPNLPINQFGFIFSYNFFNYLSLDSIKQFLIQSLAVLRPGGSILFTYNNADMPAAAGYAENYFMTYVPKSILIPMVESIGFETVFSFDRETALSLVEFKKPGKLTAIKAGQTMGKINPIHH